MLTFGPLRAGLSRPVSCVFFGRALIGVCAIGEAVLRARAGERDFLFMFATRGQSHERECVNYYSVNSRLKKEAAHTMKRRCEYSLRDTAGAFSRQEIKQNIQYNLIGEHNFEAAFEVIERALSLCQLVLLQPFGNKHDEYVQATCFPFCNVILSYE